MALSGYGFSAASTLTKLILLWAGAFGRKNMSDRLCDRRTDIRCDRRQPWNMFEPAQNSVAAHFAGTPHDAPWLQAPPNNSRLPLCIAENRLESLGRRPSPPWRHRLDGWIRNRFPPFSDMTLLMFPRSAQERTMRHASISGIAVRVLSLFGQPGIKAVAPRGSTDTHCSLSEHT